MRQRTRSVLRRPKNGGEVCDANTETQPCSTESCSADCELDTWSSWSGCTAACNTGYRERRRQVLKEARGEAGSCPSERGRRRFQLQRCNRQKCAGDEFCIARQDVVIALDSSASTVDNDGFTTTKSFVEALLDRYKTEAYDQPAARIGLVQFGNGEVLADGSASKAEQVLGLSTDLAKVKQAVQGLQQKKGFSNMAQAMSLADRMYQTHGRSEAEPLLLIISGSKPPFKDQAIQKARDLRKKGIRVFIVALPQFAKSEETLTLRAMANLPRRASFVHIPGMSKLKAHQATFVQQVVAAACPRSESPSEDEKEDKILGFQLLRERKKCGTPGRAMLSRYAKDPQKCYELAKAKGSKYFGYRMLRRRYGFCFTEMASDDTCSADGFKRSITNFYKILG